VPLVTSKNLLEDARKRRYAVGGFNASNMEMVQAIVEAAQEERAPVIVQISQGALRYAGREFCASIVKTAAELASVPVVLHLDHGKDYPVNVRCLREGFTSLMYDGSDAPFEENVRETKRVVEAAHICGVPVEAELGKVPRIHEFANLLGRDYDFSSPLPEAVRSRVGALFPSPDAAAEFVGRTGCDSLAIACGSVHGMKAAVQPLNIRLIEIIASRVGIPLVLHGSSGVVKTAEDAKKRTLFFREGEGSIEDAIERGVAKINVSTDLQLVFLGAIEEAFKENPREKDLRKLFVPARDALKRRVREYIRLFRSSGRVKEEKPARNGAGRIIHDG
jgi:fructose-bisphosphate aldolase class II